MIILIHILIFVSIVILTNVVVGMVGKYVGKTETKGPDTQFIRNIYPIISLLASINKKLPLATQRIKYKRLILFTNDPFGLTLEEFLALRELLGIVFGFILYFLMEGSLMYSAIGAIAGFSLPMIRLNSIKSDREKDTLRNLPVFLDFITLVMQGGIDFNMAIKKTIAYFKNNVVSELFGQYLEDTQMGTSREEALTHLQTKSDLEEFSFLITSLIQANRLGVSLSSTLNIQSEQMRLKRLRAAEKAAGQAPGKIIIPMMLFIFPALLLIVLGPIALKLMQTF